MKRIFTLFFLALSLSAFSQSTTVVISQVYGGGGGGATSGATYQNDYVELHNVSNVSQDISGWSIQYGSSSGNFGASATAIYTFPANTVIPAGKYVLVQLGTAGVGGQPLPVTPDYTTTNIAASSQSGKFALVNNSTALGCGSTASPCNLATNTAIVDVVAYGASNNGEGGTTVGNSTALAANQGAVRKDFGCMETNNNNNDFFVVDNPIPRNLASAAVICSTLPVSLTTFTASLVNNKASITWNTVNEQNLRGYSVEKSNNGRSYSEIAFVNANNRSSNTYSSQDINIAPGANYYRLKMVDRDGSFTYSNVVVLNAKAIKAVVFPNPVISSLTVSHDVADKGAVIRIMSMEGRQVKVVNVQSGSQQTSLQVNELVAGNYMLLFESNGQKVTTKFTKQ